LLLFAGTWLGAICQVDLGLQRLHSDSSTIIQVQDKPQVHGLAGALLRGYKWLFSSQDGSNCTFHPSCSNYAAQSVRKKGFVRGLLAGFDRLVRCHAIEPEQYHYHSETGKQHDPVP
jgi:hypothetical protein